MLILSTVLYSVQQVHHLASLCTRRDGRADATMRATWTLPAQLLHIAGYVPTGMEHSVTASGFRQGARSPFFPASGRPVRTRIDCLCQCVCCQTFTPRNASVVIFRSNANAQVLVCTAKFKPRSGILPPLRTIPADLSGGAQLMALAITLRRWSPRIQSQSKRPFILIRSR